MNVKVPSMPLICEPGDTTFSISSSLIFLMNCNGSATTGQEVNNQRSNLSQLWVPPKQIVLDLLLTELYSFSGVSTTAIQD